MGLSFVEHYDAATVVVDDDALVAVRERIAADGPRLPLAGPALDEAARQAARQAAADLVDKQTLDAVLEKIKRDGLRLTGPGGFLSEPGGCRPSSPSTWARAGLGQARPRRGGARGIRATGRRPRRCRPRLGRSMCGCRGTGPARSPRCCCPKRPPLGRTVRCGHQPVRRRDNGARHLPPPAPRLPYRRTGRGPR